MRSSEKIFKQEFRKLVGIGFDRAGREIRKLFGGESSPKKGIDRAPSPAKLGQYLTN